MTLPFVEDAGHLHPLKSKFFNSPMHRRSATKVCNDRNVPIHCPPVDPFAWASVLSAATPSVTAELLRLRATLLSPGTTTFPTSRLLKADADDLLVSEHVEIVTADNQWQTTGTCTPFFVLEEREAGPRRRFILWPKAQNLAAYAGGFKPDVPLDHVSRYLAAVRHECAGLRDLKVAFWQMELSPQERANFRFKDELGRILQPTRLPMGFCASVDILHRITEVVAGSPGFARDETPGVDIDCWVDGIRAAGDFDTVRAAMRTIDRRAEELGVTFKEHAAPHADYDFVGVHFDHLQHRTRCKDAILAKLDAEVITARDFLALFGRAVFAAGANRTPLAKFYWAIKRMRRLSSQLQKHPQQMWLPLDPPPSPTFLAQLAQMRALATQWSPIVAQPKELSAILFSDASFEGWGAVLCVDNGEVFAAGDRWCPRYEGADISVLECEAVRCGLFAFYERLATVGRLELRVDNTSTEAALARGVARADGLNAALLPVLRHLAEHFPSCRTSVGYVPTAQNPADGPSRGRAPGPVPRHCAAPPRPLRISV